MPLSPTLAGGALPGTPLVAMCLEQSKFLNADCSDVQFPSEGAQLEG